MIAELKPCPFCGSANTDPEFSYCADADGTKSYSPGCMDCGGNADDAAAWNRRADLAPSADYVAGRDRGYVDGYKSAIADIEAMRATPGILAGQSLIVTGLKISLTKMTQALAARPDQPDKYEYPELMAALDDATEPHRLVMAPQPAADTRVVTTALLRQLNKLSGYVHENEIRAIIDGETGQ
ncbi:Lar family restriction alleviation protein [Cypionkella sp. TWP1-2-1b2]|uniref:Lar family restriction alleviation protein n=1 Tax=Cypionkella sp. TWP1-2-1b2 TaxID=2804675 RepID=UPI003CF366D7